MKKQIALAIILLMVIVVKTGGVFDRAAVVAVAMLTIYLLAVIPLGIYHSYHNARAGSSTESATMAWWLRMGVWAWLLSTLALFVASQS